MKIIDCEKQLKKIVFNYFKIDDLYTDLNNKISYIDRNNITFNNIYKIMNIIDSIRRNLPLNISEEMDIYFEPFDDLDIDEIKKHMDYIKNLFNDDTYLDHNKLRFELSEIKEIKDESNSFKKIYKLYTFLNKYIYPKSFELVNAKPDEVFLACCNAKNTIWEYMNSLELPTEPDYVIEERQRRGEY